MTSVGALIERMWNNAFKYTADEQMAYTMWWYEGGTAGTADGHDNPNDLITQNRGKTVPDQVAAPLLKAPLLRAPSPRVSLLTSPCAFFVWLPRGSATCGAYR